MNTPSESEFPSPSAEPRAAIEPLETSPLERRHASSGRQASDTAGGSRLPRSRWKNHFRPTPLDLRVADRFRPGQRRAIVTAELMALIVGSTAAVLRHGLRTLTTPLAYELGVVVLLALLTLTVTMVLRDRASLIRETFRRRYTIRFGILAFWIAGSVVLAVIGPYYLGLPGGRWENLLIWADLMIGARTLASAIGFTRGLTAGAVNPGLLLSGSFVVLITIGTLLLLLPKCRAAEAAPGTFGDRVRIALFTATSASCVTGLIVVPTGGPEAYWSTTGQMVICGLFQIGGLGIMTCGAFFAITTSRGMRLRETATLRELFDSDQPINVRHLVYTVLLFTFGSELVGAVALSGLWSDKPFLERAGYSLFHSVSAFCNAGFDLTGESFMGRATRPEVWGGMAALIIIGGLGFGTLHNLWSVSAERYRLWRYGRRRLLLKPTEEFARPKSHPARLSISVRLILVTTAVLLVIGTAWLYFFEATQHGVAEGKNVPERLADAWFQSVVFRTAGFNTVDMAELRPASKLFAIVLMFIGASPISTGGGVKTTAVAIAVLALVAIMRGRPRVEAFGRTVPEEVVKRALTVIALGGSTLVLVTWLLVAFEDESQMSFLNLMFEAASACGTVGVSTGLTARLSVPSQVVLMLAMFLGRIGPLTILLGLAGQKQAISEFEYPEERVSLG